MNIKKITDQLIAHEDLKTIFQAFDLLPESAQTLYAMTFRQGRIGILFGTGFML